MHALCIGNDSIYKVLDNIEIVEKRYNSPIKNSDAQTIRMDMSLMHQLPKILSNADPLHYSQLLPGVQTNAEYDAGLHIHGCENSHNIVAIEGVTIYNPSHMLGLFSTFNASHFTGMSLRKNSYAGDSYNRIGGSLNMELPCIVPQKTNGEYTIGVMSSQGTLRTPIGRNSALFVSLRASYLNLLYGPLLKFDDGQLKYSFGDLNLTFLHNINDKHTLIFDIYTGKDNATIEGIKSDFYFDTDLNWGNLTAAAHWKYKNKTTNIEQSLYYTGYRNRLLLKNSYNEKLPSEIYDFSYRGEASFNKYTAGLSITEHHIKPQAQELGASGIIKKREDEERRTIETSIYAKYSDEIFRNLHYELALKSNIYYVINKAYTHTSLNPAAIIFYETPNFGHLEFFYTMQTQYLHNNGFSTLGLPVEFWFSSDKTKRPQYTHTYQLNYLRGLFNNRYSISLSAYYKKLYNQLEYEGTPLDLLNKEYSLNNNLIRGDGYNYGVNLILNKCTGKLTGWVSYSYGRARRKFDIYGNKWFSANHERIHELNAIATLQINKRIDIGGTFVYASGTPFTAPKAFYMINGNIITEFGEHNANRLRPYIRLDLSMNYDIIQSKNKRGGINLSIYNVLFRGNEIYYRLKIYEGQYGYRGVTFLTKILPSLGFYYKF